MSKNNNLNFSSSNEQVESPQFQEHHNETIFFFNFSTNIAFAKRRVKQLTETSTRTLK